METKQEFIDRYCKATIIPRSYILENFEAELCECDYKNCSGWRMIKIQEQDLNI